MPKKTDPQKERAERLRKRIAEMTAPAEPAVESNAKSDEPAASSHPETPREFTDRKAREAAARNRGNS